MSAFLHYHHVHYTYPRQSRPAVKDISFSLVQGEFLGILGADDAGKSTLAQLMNGLLPPTQGTITIHGMQLNAQEASRSTSERQNTLQHVRRKIGVVFSDPENQIVGTTVEEEVAFGPGNLCLSPVEIRRRVAFYLERVGLAGCANRSPHELSGGEQQKLCLAGALAMEPECLVLDEPLTFLDQKNRREVLSLLKEIHDAGKTVIYLTSDPEELTDAQRILLLRRGEALRVCAPAELWKTPTLLTEAGIYLPDALKLRTALIASGYALQPDSLSPDAIAHDLLRHKNASKDINSGCLEI